MVNPEHLRLLKQEAKYLNSFGQMASWPGSNMRAEIERVLSRGNPTDAWHDLKRIFSEDMINYD